MIQNSKFKIQNYTKSGFSFIEMIVAIFIFALVVTASAEVFVKMIKSYKSAREIQRDLENAQYAMNLMAKTIRTSSVLSCGDAGGSFNGDCSNVPVITAIKIFDYSRSKCMIYNFDGAVKLQYMEPSTAGINLNECKNDSVTWDIPQDMISGTATGGYVNGSFAIIQSVAAVLSPVATPAVVGKATISMQVCPASSCPAGSDKAIIQTSVSLRDYTETGL